MPGTSPAHLPAPGAPPPTPVVGLPHQRPRPAPRQANARIHAAARGGSTPTEQPAMNKLSNTTCPCGGESGKGVQGGGGGVTRGAGRAERPSAHAREAQTTPGGSTALAGHRRRGGGGGIGGGGCDNKTLHHDLSFDPK